MRATYQPEALRRKQEELNPFHGAEFEFLVKRSRECLLWQMTPEYYDNLSHIEYMAWIAAWNELQKESNTH